MRWAALAVLLVACGSSPGSDGGVPQSDDAGERGDAGAADAGPPDAPKAACTVPPVDECETASCTADDLYRLCIDPRTHHPGLDGWHPLCAFAVDEGGCPVGETHPGDCGGHYLDCDTSLEGDPLPGGYPICVPPDCL